MKTAPFFLLISSESVRRPAQCTNAFFRFFTESWGIEQHLFHDPLDNEPLAA